MADSFGTCPFDVFADDRLEGQPLAVITGFVTLMMLADDHGIIDVTPRTLSHRLYCGVSEIKALLETLEGLNMIYTWDSPDSEGGRPKRGCRVIKFHEYKGHPKRKSNPSQRGASCLPLPEGAAIPSRRARKSQDSERATNVQPTCDRCAASVSGTCKRCARRVQRESIERNAGAAATSRQDRKTERTERAEQKALRSQDALSAAPLIPQPQGAADGASRGASQTDPASGTKPDAVTDGMGPTDARTNNAGVERPAGPSPEMLAKLEALKARLGRDGVPAPERPKQPVPPRAPGKPPLEHFEPAFGKFTEAEEPTLMRFVTLWCREAYPGFRNAPEGQGANPSSAMSMLATTLAASGPDVCGRALTNREALVKACESVLLEGPDWPGFRGRVTPAVALKRLALDNCGPKAHKL